MATNISRHKVQRHCNVSRRQNSLVLSCPADRTDQSYAGTQSAQKLCLHKKTPRWQELPYGYRRSLAAELSVSQDPQSELCPASTGRRVLANSDAAVRAPADALRRAPSRSGASAQHRWPQDYFLSALPPPLPYVDSHSRLLPLFPLLTAEDAPSERSAPAQRGGRQHRGQSQSQPQPHGEGSAYSSPAQGRTSPTHMPGKSSPLAPRFAMLPAAASPSLYTFRGGGRAGRKASTAPRRPPPPPGPESRTVPAAPVVRGCLDVGALRAGDRAESESLTERFLQHFGAF